MDVDVFIKVIFQNKLELEYSHRGLVGENFLYWFESLKYFIFGSDW